MIDPLETVIAALALDVPLADLVGGRIAAKHRYGASWTVGQAGLAVYLSGGTPDLYRGQQEVRLELRAYAGSQVVAMRIWQRLVRISRELNRQVVNTANGKALLYALYQASGPSLLFDPDLGMDFALAFFEAHVSEEAVG
jgi:hypothetical protein